MNIEEENGPELIITRSSSKDGGIGWNIRLIRQYITYDVTYIDKGGAEATDIESRPETDEEYFQRAREMLERCLKGLLGQNTLAELQEARITHINVKENSNE